MTTFLAHNTDEWRAWLAANGRTSREVWLVIHHKDSPTYTPRYHEAIEHALCFGWIDSLHRKNDEHSSRLRFTPRSPRSNWSKLNRERAERMTARGLMTEAGQAAIDLAQAAGKWVPTASSPAQQRPRASASTTDS